MHAVPNYGTNSLAKLPVEVRKGEQTLSLVTGGQPIIDWHSRDISCKGLRMGLLRWCRFWKIQIYIYIYIYIYIWLDLQEPAYRISHWLRFPSPHKLHFLVFSEASWTLCCIKIKRRLIRCLVAMWGTFLATHTLPPQKTHPTPLQEEGVYCRLFSDSTIPASKYFIITPDDNWRVCNPRKERRNKPLNMAMIVTRVWQCTFPLPPPSPLLKLGSGMHTLSMQ